MAHSNKLIINTLKLLIYLYPITFIFGNLIINVSTLLIFVLGLIYFKNLFVFNDKKIIIYVSLFFILIIFSTILELILNGYYDDWIKSLFYLRFFLLLLVLKALIYNGLLNLNYFLSISLFITGFVSLDIIIQFILEKTFLDFHQFYFLEDQNIIQEYFKKS